jgi:Domain of unknown function (DUF4157)
MPLSSNPRPGPEMISSLQRTIGNFAVQRLLSGHAAPDEPRPLEPLTTGGQPLDASVRAEMEARFGVDFGAVRVHIGGEAARSASEFGAHAYTSGTELVFASGKYAPGTPEGKRTLAHELAHVIQQSEGPVAGTEITARVSVSDPSDDFEQDAERTADAVTEDNVGGPPTNDSQSAGEQAAGDTTIAGSVAQECTPTGDVIQRLDDDWQGHVDPFVGQNKAVDPKDQTVLGLGGTFDLSGQRPRVTNAYVDAPKVGGGNQATVSPSGDPLKFPQDYSQNAPVGGGNFQGPNDPIGGSGPCPPGKERNAIGWCQGTLEPLPRPGPAPAPQLGDFNVPDDYGRTA